MTRMQSYYNSTRINIKNKFKDIRTLRELNWVNGLQGFQKKSFIRFSYHLVLHFIRRNDLFIINTVR